MPPTLLARAIWRRFELGIASSHRTRGAVDVGGFVDCAGGFVDWREDPWTEFTKPPTSGLPSG